MRFVLALAIAGCWRASDPPPAQPVPPPPAPTGGASYGGTSYAAAQVGLGTRTPNVPMVSAGAPTSHGDLDKAEIRRAIKQHISAISACYEKMPANGSPRPSGLVVQFFIDPTGAVTHSSASGVDPVVDQCVADVIKGIKFPAPRGGGGVQVNYPFNFSAAGSP